MKDNIFKRTFLAFIFSIFSSVTFAQQQNEGLVNSTFTLHDTIFIARHLTGNCPYQRFILDSVQAKHYRSYSPNYFPRLKNLNIDSTMNDYSYPKEFIRQIEESNIACKGSIDIADFPKEWQDLSIFKDKIYICNNQEVSTGLKYQKGYFFEDVGWMIGVMPIKILSLRKLNRFQHELVTVSTFYDSVMYYNTEVITLIDTVKKIYAWGNKSIRTPLNNIDMFAEIITETDCKLFPIHFKETDYIQQRIYEIEEILREERERKQ